MSPLAVALLSFGTGSLLVGFLLVRSVGRGARIGRLLAAARNVPIADARKLAADGAPAYVRVEGRITSDEEFPDDHERPLVFRRTRIEAQGDGRWTSLMDEREAVPFALETRSESIAIDEAALLDGLVVIPRESVGTVADLPDDLKADVAATVTPDTPARLTIHQLSAVEHATACGVPVLRDGEPTLTAGLGRPLIVTSLDQNAAMRVLAGERRGRLVVGTLAAIGGFLMVVAGIVIRLLIG
ncbi:MAG TPA: hypothetical protein VMZ33_02910 [Candidatus Limnocylindrales bacterium]|nr:hypothetical protein [Candidatus Limnocylindrales bacterium]